MHHKCGTGHSSQAESQSQVNSPSNASEDPEDAETDAQSDEMENTMPSVKKVKGESLAENQQETIMTPGTPPIPLPLNLSGIPLTLPEQTEPEDLSMSTGKLASASNTSNDSSSSTTQGNSPSNDAVQEDDETRDIPAAKSSTLFSRQSRRKCSRRQNVDEASTSKGDLPS